MVSELELGLDVVVRYEGSAGSNGGGTWVRVRMNDVVHDARVRGKREKRSGFTATPLAATAGLGRSILGSRITTAAGASGGETTLAGGMLRTVAGLLKRQWMSGWTVS